MKKLLIGIINFTAKLLLLFVFVSATIMIYFHFSNTFKIGDSFIFQVIGEDQKKDDIDNLVSKIENIMNLQFEKTIQLLNSNILFFSTAMAFFFILVGFISTSKIKEVNKSLNEMEQFPDRIVNTFYSRQLENHLREIFSPNKVKKAEAIKFLAVNPKLGDEHYDSIFHCFKSDYDTKDNWGIYNHFPTLANILFQINNERASKDFIEFIDNIIEARNFNQANLPTLSMHMCFIDDNLLSEKIEKYISTVDGNLGNTITQYLLMSSKFKNEYRDYLFYSDNEATKGMFVGQFLYYFPDENPNDFIEYLKKHKLSPSIINQLNSVFVSSKKIDTSTWMEFVVEICHNDSDLFVQLNHINSNLLSEIYSDPEMLRKYILSLKDVPGFKEFYEKHKRRYTILDDPEYLGILT